MLLLGKTIGFTNALFCHRWWQPGHGGRAGIKSARKVKKHWTKEDKIIWKCFNYNFDYFLQAKTHITDTQQFSLPSILILSISHWSIYHFHLLLQQIFHYINLITKNQKSRWKEPRISSAACYCSWQLWCLPWTSLHRPPSVVMWFGFKQLLNN